MKSKRAALRFKCMGERVRYKTAFEDGEAVLIDISTHGCALSNMSVPVDEGEIMLIVIQLQEQDAVIEMQAEVVRCTADTAATRFTIAEKATKLTIRTYFSQKMRVTIKG